MSTSEAEGPATGLPGGRLLRAGTVEQVVALVRSRILRGEVAPGEALRESRIAASLGASRNTVREALRQLTSTRLVRYDTNRGFSVPRLDPDEVRDIYTVRRTLEIAALRRGFERIEGIGPRLEDLAGRMGRASEARDWNREFELDMAFHATLVSLLESPRLDAVFSDTVAGLRLALVGLDRTRRGGLRREHRDLLAALLSGSRKTARKALEDHLGRSERGLLEFVQATSAR